MRYDSAMYPRPKITWKENTEERFTLLKLSYKLPAGLEPALLDWKSSVLANYTREASMYGVG